MTRVIFFGQSLAIFDWLVLQVNIDLVAVYTTRLLEANRGDWMMRALLAEVQLIEIDQKIEIDEALPPNLDLGICAHFEIIPQQVITRFRLGIINIHPAPLPEYAGRYPLIELCLKGERNAGVSLHWMSQEIDRGDLIAVERFPKHPLEGPLELERRAERAACLLLREHWEGVINGYAPRISQASLSSLPTPPVKHSRVIPFLTDFDSLEHMMRALIAYAPYGGLALQRFESQNEIIRIHKAQLIRVCLAPTQGDDQPNMPIKKKTGVVERYVKVLSANEAEGQGIQGSICLEIEIGWALNMTPKFIKSSSVVVTSELQRVICYLSLIALWTNRSQCRSLKEDLTQLIGQRLYNPQKKLSLT